jgi:tetratricopeptide (TPR) repeat protein
MDDFMVDDIVALHDFSLSFPVNIEFLGRRQGGVPHSVFGRMVRIEFTPSESEESPSDVLERAEGLVNAGQFGDALALWDELRKSHRQLMAAWVRAAFHLRNNDRITEAEVLLDDARWLFPEEVEPTAQWAFLAQIQKDWPEALRRWKHAHEQFPNHASPYYGCAVALRELHRLDEAEILLTDALRRFSNDPGVVLEYAWLAHIRNDWSVALPRWENARAVAPHHPGGFIWGAQALCGLGRGDDAEALLREACILFPEDATVAIELANLFENKGDWVRAEECWRNVATRFPGTKGAAERLAVAQARQRGSVGYRAIDMD